MSRVGIGRVIAIDNLSIKVELFSKYISSFTVINGKAIRVGGVSGIVICSNFVYQIVSEHIAETKDGTVFENRYLTCNLLGYIKNNTYFEGTDGDTPNIYDIVYMGDEDLIRRVYSNIENNDNCVLGYYTMMQNIEFEFNVNKLFASHILIVGNTGSGKSNTLAKLYECLFDNKKYNFKKSRFLFIDTNGEFNNSFTDDYKLKKIVNIREDKDNQLQIPIQHIDDNNWGLMLDATEKTQFPIIRAVMRRMKKIFNNEKSITDLVNDTIQNVIKEIISSGIQINQRLLSLEKIINNHPDLLNKSSCDEFRNILGKYSANGNKIVIYGDVFTDRSKELLKDLKDIKLFDSDLYSVSTFAYLLYLEYLLRIYKYNVIENNMSPMISRMANKEDSLKNFIIPFTGKQVTTKEYIDELFEKYPIVILNMENCPKDLKILFVSLISENFYQYSITKKQHKCNGSYHLIIEEAHNYLEKKSSNYEDALYDNCLNLFEKIIKEGRKYGLFMTISTQRPSEISETIISQMHNFFIHKLVNTKDMTIIKSAVPFLDEMSEKMLPILSPGQCIATGTAFKKPNLVQIKQPTNIVESKTIKLTDLWSR